MFLFSFGTEECCDIIVIAISFKFNFQRIKDLTLIPSTSIKLINEVPLYYPAIEHLQINGYAFQFIGILTENCKKLKSLHIRHCLRIDDEEFRKLTTQLSLQSLSLGQAENLSCKTFIEILTALKRLKNLSLIGSEMNYSLLCNQVLNYPNIVKLDLSMSKISDRGLKGVVSCMKNIVDLCVSNCKQLTHLSYDYIAELHNLKYLNISYLSEKNNFNTNVEMCLITIGMHLQVLNLSGMGFVHTDILAKCCPNLEELYLNHCTEPEINWVNLNDAVRSDFYWLRHQEKFSLLEVCRNLHTLSISCMSVAESDLPKLLTDGNMLKMFKFLPWSKSFTAITESFFVNLFKTFHFDKLEELDLTHNDGITKRVVLLLWKLYPGLKRLRIFGCNVNSEELLQLKEILRKAKLDMIVEVSWDYMIRFL